MTPERLRTQLLALLPSQLEELIHDQLSPEEAAHVPTRPACPAERVQAIVTLAGQSDPLRQRLEAAFWSLSGGIIPAGVPASVVEWITTAASQHRWIRVVGFQERYKIRLALEDIFVPLRARVGRRKQQSLRGDKLAEDFVESRVVDLPEALRMASETPATAGLVILGNPGAGKTTLLKQLFIRVAREGSKAVGLPEGLFPVLLRCSQLETDDLRPRGLGLAVEREAKRGGFPLCGERLIEARAPILFLLDGLDEVRDENARARLCEWLDEEVAFWPGSRFVVTCRFAAWRREAKLDVRFVPVDPGRPEEAQQRATESSDKLLKQLLNPKRQATLRLRELTENPLLLSTLCLVHHSEWKLPDRRGDLYDGCIRLLLENWTARRAGEPTLPEKAARLVLQPLAWAMHLEEARDWPTEKVVAAIKKPLSELPDLPMSPEAFLERARDDCGVLASKDLGSYEFFHLSFQEYLAAIHAREQGLISELASHAGKPWWREVVLLAAAQPAVLGELVRALAHAADSGSPQVVRGGSWRSLPGRLRCAYRRGYHPENRDLYLGFRVVCRGSRNS